MADLFEQLDSVFNKRVPEEYLYHLVLNRWLASDRDLAPAARVINNATWDDRMAWQIWRAALPRAPKAPQVYWPAPKKALEAEELIQRFMEVHNVRREVAEEWEEIISSEAGFKKTINRMHLQRHYGIKPASG